MYIEANFDFSVLLYMTNATTDSIIKTFIILQQHFKYSGTVEDTLVMCLLNCLGSSNLIRDNSLIGIPHRLY